MAIFFPLKPRPSGARKPPAHVDRSPGEPPPVSHGYFRTFDGTKLFYSIEGKGPPLIFCYGLVCSSLHWTYQIEHFRKTHQSIWFDYRGHQNSDVPEDMSSLTIENIARDLGCLMDELGLKDAVILGHSMGVNVVLDFYKLFPDRVRGMVLANGTAQRPLETLFKNNALETGFKLLQQAHELSPKAIDAFWKFQRNNPIAKTIVALGGFNPHLTPAEDIQLYVNQVAEMDPGILISLISSYAGYDATPWLHTVKVPTMIMAGDQDYLIPLPQQELMHQLIPKSQLEVIRHGSHCPQMDLPELINAKIEKFLERVEATST